MALPRWLKWTLGGVGACAVAAGALVGSALWFLDARISPDVKLGEPLPSAQLARLDGTTLELEGYRGQVVVLDFWSSW